MANLWTKFAELLPASPRLIGSVVTLHGDGTASITLLSGGIVRAQINGISVVTGSRVFVRDGKIEGEAPTLPQVEIEI